MFFTRTVLTSALLCCPIVSVTAAETTLEPASCEKLDDSKVRVACLAAATALKEREKVPSPIEATADAVVPVGLTSFTDLDRRALFASPARFVRKPLRLRGARCTYADVGDYLCALHGRNPVDVRAKVVIPPSAQTVIETRCGTLNGVRRASCGSTILFIANSIDTETDQGRQKMVIRTTGLTVVSGPQR